MTRKTLLSLALCSCLLCYSATTCFAEQMYQMSATQLQQLKNNTKTLKQDNKKQLELSIELKRQVKILQAELTTSKQALEKAQQLSAELKQSLTKLEKQVKSIKHPKVGLGVIASNHGVAPELNIISNKLQFSAFYSSQLQGGSITYFF